MCGNLWNALQTAKQAPPPESGVETASVRLLIFRREGKSFLAEATSLKDVGVALSEMYRGALQNIARSQSVSERRLREAFSELFITSSATRGLVDAGALRRAGIPQSAADALVEQRVLRREPRAGAVWYELTHDRLIEPVKRDNVAWQQRRRRPFVYAWITAAMLAIVTVSSVIATKHNENAERQLRIPAERKAAEIDKLKGKINAEADGLYRSPMVSSVSVESDENVADDVLGELEIRDKRLKEAAQRTEVPQAKFDKLQADLATCKNPPVPATSNHRKPKSVQDAPAPSPPPPNVPIASVIVARARVEPI